MLEATQFKKDVRRNFKVEFIENAEFIGKYQLPKLKATKYIPEKVISFNLAKTEKQPQNKWVHFFIDDYQFERIWNFPQKYLSLFKRFNGIITPDFSMYSYLPKAQQIWNCYRNRAYAHWLQINDIRIIPTVEWSDFSDFDWCLDGLPKNSSLAIGTYGCNTSLMNRYGLIKGIEKVCAELEPYSLILYGNRIKSIDYMCKNVIWLENYCNQIKKRI